MKRGDLVTVAAGSGFGSKPRPAIIVQADAFALLGSVTICLLTSTDRNAPLIRIPVSIEEAPGLQASSFAMIDKLITVRREKVSATIGRISPERMREIDRAIIVFLGLASG